MDKNRKLISLDLDGTLLNSSSKITKETEEYIKELINKGHKIIINSGRAVRALMKFYRQLELDTPLICYNGAKVFDPNDPNYPVDNFEFKKEDVISIREDLDGVVLSYMAETDSHIWADQHDDFLFNFYTLNNMKSTFGNIREVLHKNPISFVLKYVDTPENRAKITAKVHSFENLRVRFWDTDNYCELYYEGVSKYHALLKIADYYDIDHNNIYAFGDADNDIELLSSIKHGVAMKNASQMVKDVAEYITEYTNNENGVIRWMQEHFKD